MAEEREFDPKAKVRDVIAQLLGAALPAELAGVATGLIDRVAEQRAVARHMQKRWGQLTESEANIVAREVGIVARDVVISGNTSESGGEARLH